MGNFKRKLQIEHGGILVVPVVWNEYLAMAVHSVPIPSFSILVHTWYMIPVYRSLIIVIAYAVSYISGVLSSKSGTV